MDIRNHFGSPVAGSSAVASSQTQPEERGAVTVARWGPLPGPRQTNNRAEIYALLDAIGNTEGPMEFWTDSTTVLKG